MGMKKKGKKKVMKRCEFAVSEKSLQMLLWMKEEIDAETMGDVVRRGLRVQYELLKEMEECDIIFRNRKTGKERMMSLW